MLVPEHITLQNTLQSVKF